MAKASAPARFCYHVYYFLVQSKKGVTVIKAKQLKLRVRELKEQLFG